MFNPLLSEQTTAETIAREARKIAIEQDLKLPFPGQGRTYERWQALMHWARMDLCFAKLLESHYDALAILDEAGKKPKKGFYAVWASKFGGKGLKAQKKGMGWRIEGDIAFASGAHAVDHALVPVATDAGERLLELPRSLIQSIDVSRWPTEGMALADTAWLSVRGEVDPEAVFGEPRFYLDRWGFWPGGMGVAACWLAAAEELFHAWQDSARKKNYRDPHDEAKRGHAASLLKATHLSLEHEADRLDSLAGRHEQLKSNALMLRHLVDHTASTILEDALKAQGPGLLLANRSIAKRFSDLQLFLRQCHAEKDLVALTEELEREHSRPNEVNHVEYGRIRDQSRPLVHSL